MGAAGESMKKIGLVCMMFTVLATFGVQAQGSDTVETWHCFTWIDIFVRKKVSVELTRATEASGQVSVAGITYSALFYIEGINRRWDFGEDIQYSFIISPDGRGSYYDFSRVEEGETTWPSQEFYCMSPWSLELGKP